MLKLCGGILGHRGGGLLRGARVALAFTLILTLETTLNARTASVAYPSSSQSLLGTAIRCQAAGDGVRADTKLPSSKNSGLQHSCADCLRCLLLGAPLDAPFDFHVALTSNAPPIQPERDAAPTSPQRAANSARAPPRIS